MNLESGPGACVAAGAADRRFMTETIIVRNGSTLGGSPFSTYSGWVINRTSDTVVFAAISEFSEEPVAVLIPVDAIISEAPVAA
jgi:hypothetical protein